MGALLTLALACSPAGSMSACSDGAAPRDGGPIESGVDGGGPPGLPFSACPLLADPAHLPPWPGLDGAASAMAECATVPMPAVWSAPAGDTIDVFVKRYPAAYQPATGQLWILQGGPGFPTSGSHLEAWAFLVGKAEPSLDVYLPDHRGTGKSTRASCLVTSGTAATCAASTPHLQGLGTTDAANDVAALIDATRGPSQRLFVYSRSYGSYWAQRYLELRPDQPTAVVLDSTVPAAGFDLGVFDETFDAAARAVLDLCKADATCAAKLGADPLATAKAALAALEGGSCSLPWTRAQMRMLFGSAVGTGYFERVLLPAGAYRLLRCDAADVAWLQKVAKHLSTYFPTLTGYSSVVYTNVALSELWATSATQADLEAKEQTMIATSGGPPGLAALAPVWPKYARDATFGRWPDSKAPILVLQGTLDPRTPISAEVKARYSGPNRYYVEVPLANHVVVLDSPTAADPMGSSCGWEVMRSFLADPQKAPDTSCLSALAPLDFGNPPAWWLAQVGVSDLWENPPSGDAGASDASSD